MEKKETKQASANAQVKFFDNRQYVMLTTGGKRMFFRSTSECVNYCNENGIEAEVEQ